MALCFIIVCISWSQTSNLPSAPTHAPQPWQPQIKTIFIISIALEIFIVTIFHPAHVSPYWLSSHSLVIKFVLSGAVYVNFSQESHYKEENSFCSLVQTYKNLSNFPSKLSVVLESWIFENILRSSKDVIPRNSTESVTFILNFPVSPHALNMDWITDLFQGQCGALQMNQGELNSLSSSSLWCGTEDMILRVRDIWVTVHPSEHIPICLFNWIFFRNQRFSRVIQLVYSKQPHFHFSFHYKMLPVYIKAATHFGSKL